MKIRCRWVGLMAVGLLCGCGQMAESDNSQWETQNAEYERQMKVGADQLKRAEELYDRDEVLLKKQEKLEERMDALITKWEKQTERFDRVLDQWEKIGASPASK